jgi:hypothetical protein
MTCLGYFKWNDGAQPAMVNGMKSKKKIDVIGQRNCRKRYTDPIQRNNYNIPNYFDLSDPASNLSKSS